MTPSRGINSWHPHALGNSSLLLAWSNRAASPFHTIAGSKVGEDRKASLWLRRKENEFPFQDEGEKAEAVNGPSWYPPGYLLWTSHKISDITWLETHHKKADTRSIVCL